MTCMNLEGGNAHVGIYGHCEVKVPCHPNISVYLELKELDNSVIYGHFFPFDLYTLSMT